MQENRRLSFISYRMDKEIIHFGGWSFQFFEYIAAGLKVVSIADTGEKAMLLCAYIYTSVPQQKYWEDTDICI